MNLVRLAVTVLGFALSISAGAAPPVAPAPPAPAAASADAGMTGLTTLERAKAEIDSLLREANGDLHSEGLAALALARTPDAASRLLQALEDPDGKVRFGAARGLGLLADPKTAKVVTDRFRIEKGWAVKKELAATAVTVNASDLVPDLQRATLDPHKDLAIAAAWALVEMGDPAGKAALARLGNPDRKSPPKEGADRWARKVLLGKATGDARLAAYTLVERGTAQDVPLFTKHLTSTDRLVRAYSAAGLLRHSGSPAPAAAPAAEMKDAGAGPR